jgi:hypothetical protein
VVVIDTFGQAIPDDPKILGHMKIIYDYAGGNNSLDSPHIDFEGRIGIELRGHISLNYPKKQFGVELRDESDQDLNASLLGMPAESDWVLNAPYVDKTLIRNALAYWLSNEVFDRYAPRTQFVELYLNDTGAANVADTYAGVYVLTEKIKRDPNRVDIAALDPATTTEPDITGGYILEISRLVSLKPTDVYFTTALGTLLVHGYPKGDEIPDVQKSWIQNHINEFETALYGPNFADPDLGYDPYISVPVFIDYMLMFDVLKNVEAFRASGFIYKDKEKKLRMGPIWDFDVAMGNYEEYGFADPERSFLPFYRWAGRLLEDTTFWTQYFTRWYEIRSTKLTVSAIAAKTDELAALLAEAQERNFEKWPILGTYVYPDPPPYPPTYEEEIAQLKSWIEARILWLDASIDNAAYWEP